MRKRDKEKIKIKCNRTNNKENRNIFDNSVESNVLLSLLLLNDDDVVNMHLSIIRRFHGVRMLSFNLL